MEQVPMYIYMNGSKWIKVGILVDEDDGGCKMDKVTTSVVIKFREKYFADPSATDTGRICKNVDGVSLEEALKWQVIDSQNQKVFW